MATTSSNTHPHPLRTLLVFLACVAALYVLMGINNVWTPKLGLDLRGGTTITLTAANSSGQGAVDKDSLELARTIIQQRVDSIGVGESQVTTAGDNQIIVAVPNVAPDKLNEMVGQTAQLYFRPVYLAAQVTPPVPLPTATASPSASASPGATPTSSSGATVSAPSASPTANRRPAPMLPTPAPTARPTAAAAVQPTIDQAMAWTPSAQDQAEFAAYQCGKESPTPNVTDQPLITCDRTGSTKLLLGPVLLKGSDLKSASAGTLPGQVSPMVFLQFNDAGSALFEKATKLLGQKTQPQNSFAIVLDSKVISYPSIDGTKYPAGIAGGQAQIEGNFTVSAAQDLANVLKYGALPLSFALSEQNSISPTLGGEQLQAGIIAGIIGLALVVLYSLLYYRGLALVVVASLALAAATTYGLMVLLGQAAGFTLSLPGIAGAIVAIGVTADSFVIYFERIRDEVRDGRTLRTAIETGWVKSRRTIVVADAVSLLAAVVLFVLAISAVKGFAFTLGLTTLIDVAIVFLFTKPLLTLLGRTKFFGEGRRFSGFEADHMGAARTPSLRRRPVTATEGQKR